MDLRFFFKNRFLKQTFGDFAQKVNNDDYESFKTTLKENRSWYIPASLFNSEDKTFKQLFNSIDGSTMNQDTFSYGQKNARLESQELYDWVKYNYKEFKGKDITDEELRNMKMSDFMKLVAEFVEKGFKLK